MELTCPFCENKIDVLAFDEHITSQCDKYKNFESIRNTAIENISKLTESIKNQKNKINDINKKEKTLDKIKRQFKSYLLQAVTNDIVHKSGVSNEFLDFIELKSKKIKRRAKQKMKEICGSLQSMIPKKIIKKFTESEKLKYVKDKTTKAGRKLWQMSVLAVAGSSVLFAIMIPYHALMGVVNYKVASMAAASTLMMIKLLLRKRNKKKKSSEKNATNNNSQN